MCRLLLSQGQRKPAYHSLFPSSSAVCRSAVPARLPAAQLQKLPLFSAQCRAPCYPSRPVHPKPLHQVHAGTPCFPACGSNHPPAAQGSFRCFCKLFSCDFSYGLHPLYFRDASAQFFQQLRIRGFCFRFRSWHSLLCHRHPDNRQRLGIPLFLRYNSVQRCGSVTD